MIADIVKEHDLYITAREARRLSGTYCVPGFRTFLENKGIDIKEAIKIGIKASDLLSFNDVMATQIVIAKYKEEGYVCEIE